MFKPTKKQISSAIGGTVMLGMAAVLVYAAVIFAPSKQPIGYISQPTLSNYNVTSSNERVYRGEYNSADLSGRFSCYPVGTNGYVDQNNPCFVSGASSPLDVQAASGMRHIGTRSDTATAPGEEFSTTGTNPLTTAQQAALGGTANINYIRGTSLSPTGLRTRTTVLGDIMHSRPYYYTDGTNPTVFVGANDGMLHAFDASTPASGVTYTGGQERWAYVPSMLLTKLSTFSSTTYVHDYFVDGSMSIGKIGLGTAGAKTILVGALGAGGKGLYALDISTLTAATGTAAGQKGLWEITNITLMGPTSKAASTSYANLGDAYSNPLLVKTQDGSDSVIVGNGYNNIGNGQASLYVINAQNGSLIQEIVTPSGNGAVYGSTTSPNGLSSPVAIDSNGDGKADRVYAGDINGNVWMFDLSSPSPLSWSAKLLYATGKSITQAPAVAIHPNGGFMVNVATGRILSDATATTIAPSTTAAPNDIADTTTVNAAYGLWDNLSGTTITTAQLINQTLTTSTYTSPAVSSVSVRSLTTDNKPNWTATPTPDRGWVTNLPIAGERVTGDGAFDFNGKFQFNVTNPTVSYTPSGSSAASKGINWLFELDFLNGGAGTGPFMDMDRSGVINDADRLTLTSGSPNMAASGIPVGYITSNGVQSQPILIQLSKVLVLLYNQNFNAPGAPGNTSSTGVAGGHFDVDIFYTGGSSTDLHDHEYDKLYDTNGLNFLNPNDQGLPLSLAVATSTTPYKVLVMNQGWNRAMNLRISTDTWNTQQYQAGPSACTTTMPCAPYVKYTSATIPTGAGIGYLDVANLPQYTGNSSTVTACTYNGTAASAVAAGTSCVANNATTGILGRITVDAVATTGSISCGGMTAAGTPVVAGSGCNNTYSGAGSRGSVGGLELSMPGDGFAIKDWWNTGNAADVMTGVMPTFYACPDNFLSNGATPAYTAGTGVMNTGPLGERHDGVITVQIIAANTPNKSVQLNVPGQPIYGFRVVDADFLTYVLAEYTLYWHHPNTVCYGDSKTTWKTTNNQRDSWWPAQTTGGTPVLTGYTTMGELKCFPNQQSGSGTVTWNTTAPATSTTTPWPEPLAFPGTGNLPWTPKGFTMQPPKDTALTLPPCPSYNAAYDDPRTASFIVGGTVATTGTSGVPATTLRNMIGGSLAGAATGTGAGGSSTTGTGAPTSGVSGTPPLTPLPNSTGRITWRELLGL
jgi:type IV pilus assembly protein PilY1